MNAIDFIAQIDRRIAAAEAEATPPPFDPEAALLSWRNEHAAMEAATLKYDERILSLTLQRDVVVLPYAERLEVLEEAIKAHALKATAGWKIDGAIVSYRKGRTTVTYDWRKVDSVAAFLKDVLPETATSLATARSETTGKPSVSVEVVR